MSDGLIHVKLLDSRAVLPVPHSGGAAGYDLCFVADAPETLLPNERKLFGTRVALSIPEGYYGRISPLHDLALRGIDPRSGVVDSDCRSEIKVLLHNAGREAETVQPGDPIAQIIFHRIGRFSVRANSSQ